MITLQRSASKSTKTLTQVKIFGDYHYFPEILFLIRLNDGP